MNGNGEDESYKIPGRTRLKFMTRSCRNEVLTHEDGTNPWPGFVGCPCGNMKGCENRNSATFFSCPMSVHTMYHMFSKNGKQFPYHGGLSDEENYDRYHWNCDTHRCQSMVMSGVYPIDHWSHIYQ